MSHTSIHPKRRYAVCGLSTRSIVHFLLPLLGIPSDFSSKDFSDRAEVVAVLDVDEGRVAAMNEKCNTSIPFYRPEDFDRMVRETRPDVILVGTPDSNHCELILAGLAHHLEVISEKPMVTSAEQANAVLAAERESRGKVRVSFNVRYGPEFIALKRFVQGGGVGRIISVEVSHLVDTRHGSSYFYRWNRERRFSGGLSIHKGCHCFDALSWIVGDQVTDVFSFGARNYYGENGILRPRDAQGHPLPLAEERAACPYYQRHLRQTFEPDQNPATLWDPLGLPYDVLYPEDSPRYIYDKEIDIEDTYSAAMRYRSGISMTYHLNFSAALSQYQIRIHGSKGMLDYASLARVFAPDDAFTPPQIPSRMDFYPLFGGKETLLQQVKSRGGHGGADELIQEDLFGDGNPALADLGLFATAQDGARAVAIGEAVWRSSCTGRPIAIADLLKG